MNASSLYIHIPFCERKCFYCSFCVCIGQKHRINIYLDSILKESRQYRGDKIKTIYIGGGTPTVLNSDQLEKLFEIVNDNFLFSSDVEYTVEVNPEGLDVRKLNIMRDAGVNRISMGIQTLNDRNLKYLGRNHDGEMAVSSFKDLRNTGFDNISLDLIYGFKDQSVDDIKRDIDGVMDLQSDHVSAYMLTIEKHSRFYSKGIETCPDNYYELIMDLFYQRGFRQYEISNYVKADKVSLHNMNYWQGGNYIGLGVGAHSHKDGHRYWNVSSVFEYIKRVGMNQCSKVGEERLGRYQQLIETLLFGLRMNQGVHVHNLEERFGCMFNEEILTKIKSFIAQGFLIREERVLKTTQKGRFVLDELSVILI